MPFRTLDTADLAGQADVEVHTEVPYDEPRVPPAYRRVELGTDDFLVAVPPIFEALLEHGVDLVLAETLLLQERRDVGASLHDAPERCGGEAPEQQNRVQKVGPQNVALSA